MKKNVVAEVLNERYAKALAKQNELMAALNQQQDIVMDLHYQYVKAVNNEKSWE